MNLSQIDDSSGIFTISQLNYFTNNTLNWLNIINSHLASEFQITENSGVLIEKPRLILKLIELMNVTPKA